MVKMTRDMISHLWNKALVLSQVFSSKEINLFHPCWILLNIKYLFTFDSYHQIFQKQSMQCFVLYNTFTIVFLKTCC